VLTTVAAVVIATYLIADRYSKPIKLLAESMAEIGKGRYDYRIAEQRDDEFGQLYREFDNMAQAIQKGSEPPRSEPPGSDPRS
jgi:serine/threonine-protein kinase